MAASSTTARLQVRSRRSRMRLAALVAAFAVAAGAAVTGAVAAGTASGVRDTFSRTVTGGWGTATTGGAWTPSSPAAVAVAAGTGRINLTAGRGHSVVMASTTSTTWDSRADFSLSRAPAGAAMYFGIIGRGDAVNGYRTTTRIDPSGTARVNIARTVSRVHTELGAAPLPLGNSWGTGTVRMRLQVTGTQVRTVRVRVWPANSAEPAAWSLIVTDRTTTAAMAPVMRAGGLGLFGYAGRTTTGGGITVRVDNFSGSPSLLPSPNMLPTAAFTSAIDGLSARVDASTSVDPDGRILSAAWQFGDGAVASGVTPPVHRYATSGRYNVTLRVTDDRGGTATLVRQIAVSRVNTPPIAIFTASTAGLSVNVDATPSSDVDGVVSRYSWDFGDGASDGAVGAGSATASHTYSVAGTYTVRLTVVDNEGATADVERRVVVTNPVVTSGARKWYVDPAAPAGGSGSLSAPVNSLPLALSRAAAGEVIVLRGGTYPISGMVTISKPVTITGYPGEDPVFEGARAVGDDVVADGDLRGFAYQPLPARIGEGLTLYDLPAPTFSGGLPTGTAANVGWRCVTGSSSYRMPGTPTSSNPSGCDGGSTPRIITGYWPDQVWVGGVALTQVSDRRLVRPGTFWVPRESSTDAAPGAGRVYISAADAVDPGAVTVSRSTGSFLRVAASDVVLDGFSIARHSPDWSQYAVHTAGGIHDVTLRNVRISDVAGIAVKLTGDSSPGGRGLLREVTLDGVSIDNPGWMGIGLRYANDVTIVRSAIRNANRAGEFDVDPQSGAVKTSRTQGLRILSSVIDGTVGHGVWCDQSTYDVVIADSRILGSTHSSVFFEISHGLVLVNNILQAAPIPAPVEAYANVRIAGSSGVALVNNTLINGTVGLGVFTDPRSHRTADGRYCSEHLQRYGQSTRYAADCAPGTSSDLDRVRPGAYGATNQTPGMNWLPQITTLVNNVFSDQTVLVPGGWSPCGGRTAICVRASLGSINVPLSSVFGPDAIIDGNVYTGTTAMPQRLIQTVSSIGGGFTAATVDQVRGAFGQQYYGLMQAESRGISAPGLVTEDGGATAALAALQGTAFPVPTDPRFNAYTAAGSRWYGARLG